jgi:hypothetical protein
VSEKYRLTVSENRVLWEILEPLRDEVTGGWRRLPNEELHNLYSPPNISGIIKSKRMRWAGHVMCISEMRNVYKILVGKLEGKRTLRRPGCRSED